jgi:DNA processing protein
LAFDTNITVKGAHSELIYQIGLCLLDGIGPSKAKKLLSYCGSAEAVFREKPSALQRIPGIGAGVAKTIKNMKVLERAEQEMVFLEKNGVRPIFFTEEGYPKRLKHCDDGPLVLYTKGKMKLNAPKVIAIVGTRKATEHGRRICEEIVNGLVAHDALIISGLAYGVDICAHRTALKNKLQTVGVVAHGLDAMYPEAHQETALQMMSNGGILTEFLSQTRPTPEQFPKRNRIVAGMVDAVLVVESGRGGGSMITANLATGYHRDVLAVPGRPADEQSTGCNLLIKSHRAAMVESIRDLEYALGWDAKESPAAVQRSLFTDLNTDEQLLCDYLRKHGATAIDNLCLNLKTPSGKASAVLLNLEFKGVVKTLPGKRYELV